MGENKIRVRGERSGSFDREDLVFEEEGVRVKGELVRVDKFLWK